MSVAIRQTIYASMLPRECYYSLTITESVLLGEEHNACDEMSTFSDGVFSLYLLSSVLDPTHMSIDITGS